MAGYNRLLQIIIKNSLNCNIFNNKVRLSWIPHYSESKFKVEYHFNSSILCAGVVSSHVLYIEPQITPLNRTAVLWSLRQQSTTRLLNHSNGN